MCIQHNGCEICVGVFRFSINVGSIVAMCFVPCQIARSNSVRLAYLGTIKRYCYKLIPTSRQDNMIKHISEAIKNMSASEIKCAVFSNRVEDFKTVLP